MIGRIRNSTILKFLWGMMGLYLFNISVDTEDPNPEPFPEDLSFNDQESIVEILVEKVLGFEDAFKEYDDHDPEDHNKKKQVKIDLVVQFALTDIDTNHHLIEKNRGYFDYEARLTAGFEETDSPPPRV